MNLNLVDGVMIIEFEFEYVVIDNCVINVELLFVSWINKLPLIVVYELSSVPKTAFVIAFWLLIVFVEIIYIFNSHT